MNFQARLDEFVLGALPAPPIRVLEVGCGRGDLARRLVEAGHEVLAIDPDAPQGPPFRRVALEELDDPGPFDAVVASRSLHHVHDLGGALDKVVGILRPGGLVVLNEHAFDQLDEPTASWYLERRQELERLDVDSPAPATLETCRAEWERDHAGLHTSEQMTAALDERFDQRSLEWGPCLHEELGAVTSAAEECSVIEQGRIRAIGFRYVGERPTW